MDYPCSQSLVMCVNTFKHNWNGFCQREKYINIYIVYEHTCFRILILISFVADAYDSTRYLESVMCFYEYNQANLFAKVYHFTIYLQQNNKNPSSHCRTIFLEEKFKLQYVRGDMLIHIHTQNIVLIFLRKQHFAWQSKYGSLP